MGRTERLWLLVFVACVLPLSAVASEGDLLDDTPLGSLSFEDADAPVAVSANELRFDYEASRLVYRGSVNVKQGNLVIDCGELEINYEGEPRGGDKLEIRSITARGDVVIRQGSRRATGDEARFDQVEKKILLLGNARLVLSDLLERRFGLVHLMFEFDNLRGQPQQLMLRPADAFDLVPHIGHLNRQASEEILEYVEFGSPAQLMSAPSSLGCHSPVAPLRGRCRDRKRNSTVRVLGNQDS